MNSIERNFIYCFFIQNSGSTETNLGTIFNNLDDGGETDDLSSHAMSVIANLNTGDKVYIEVYAGGDSYLGSNHERWISFSGFLLK